MGSGVYLNVIRCQTIFIGPRTIRGAYVGVGAVYHDLRGRVGSNHRAKFGREEKHAYWIGVIRTSVCHPGFGV